MSLAASRTRAWRKGRRLRRIRRVARCRASQNRPGRDLSLFRGSSPDSERSSHVGRDGPSETWKFNLRMPQAQRERSRQGADKRQLILDAAIKVFADKGYHGTRISDIARQAEIAYGLVYHYFKNKEDILDAIFFERWGGFIEAVESIAADGRPLAKRLLSIAEIILSSYRERSEWVKVLVFEIQRTQRFADPERVKVVGQLFNVIAGMLREGQETGELRREVDPDLACYIFIGGLDIVVTSRVLDLIPVKGEEGEYFGQIASTVVDLFLNGMVGADSPSRNSEGTQ
jgi:TetR/AcrR family fatty acid metabolism transcriptional regulator